MKSIRPGPSGLCALLVILLGSSSVLSNDENEGPSIFEELVLPAVREGMKATGVDASREQGIHPRHDFVPSDAYRLGLIDEYLKQPLLVPGDVHARFRPWMTEDESLTKSLLRAFGILGHGDLNPVSPLTKRVDLYAVLSALWTSEDAEPRSPPSASAFHKDARLLPKAARDPLARLLTALAEAVALREEAFRALSEEEWISLRKFGSQLSTGLPPHVQVQYFEGLHAKVDRPTLMKAALRIAAVIDDLDALEQIAQKPRGKRDFHIVWETPAGRVEIGGWKENTYTEDALLTVDLGGDDVYRNSAGGTLYTPNKVSVSIDLGGDDRYETEVGLAQGSGMYGVGILVDCLGNDTYISKNVSQGAGHVGVGVLWDRAGNDVYRARSVAQGTALQGVGLLRDEVGDDRYEVGFMGQGFGSTEGIGILQDRDGSDRYTAGGLVPDTGRDAKHFLTLAQGFGQGNRAANIQHCTSGGIGLLADRRGDDVYVADVFGQGCAYWYAIGVLLDGAGSDSYEVYNYGQGGGFHMAVGVLQDYAGDDRYAGQHHAQGHALDRSVAWLVEHAGNDTYEATSEGQGCAVKPYAVGFFADLAGDDRYLGGTPGYVRIPAEGQEGQWPKAFFVDFGGNDVYEPSRKEDGAENGKTWVVNTHGWGKDV